MSMSLKEFTKRHLNADTEEGEKARWRKVVPTDLRFEERVVAERLFRNDKTKMVLREKWERIHKGDVIDTEWRDVSVEYIPNYDW